MPTDTANFEIPKPLDEDKPPSLEDAVGPGFDRVDELLGAIDLSQLVVPGGSDSKLLIVKDGAVAYKAMHGDGTIDEDGKFQLGAGVVDTNELADKAITGAKVDDDTLGDGKLASPNNATWKRLGTITGASRGPSGDIALAPSFVTTDRAVGAVLDESSTSIPLAVLIAPADLAVSGKGTMLKLTWRLVGNAASGGVLTGAPVTVKGKLRRLTSNNGLGETVPGSTSELVLEASFGSAIVNGPTKEFDCPPAEGLYLFSMETGVSGHSVGGTGLIWTIDYRNV